MTAGKTYFFLVLTVQFVVFPANELRCCASHVVTSILDLWVQSVSEQAARRVQLLNHVNPYRTFHWRLIEYPEGSAAWHIW